MLLLVDLDCEFQTFYVGAVVVDVLHRVCGGLHGSKRFVVRHLVGECEFLGHRHAANLSQRHARQSQTVVNFREVYVCLVEFHLHIEEVGVGGNALAYHRFHVAVERVEQFDIAYGEFFLLSERHNLPICGVDRIDHLAGCVVVHQRRDFLPHLSHFVERADFSAHIYRLGERNGSGKEVVDVERHRLFWNQSHLCGDILSVNLHRASVGAGEEVEVVGSCGWVKRLCRKHLVA